MTMTELLSQAGLLGGHDQIPQTVCNWYNNWQARVSKSWPWPDCKRRIEGVALAASVESINFGAGANGETLQVHRIFPPILWHDSGYTTRGRALVRNRLGGNEVADETTTLATNRRGKPDTFRFQKSATTKGQFELYPDPVADVALLLTIDYQIIPAAVLYSDNTTELWYPNDRTSVQAAKTAVIDYENNGSGKELEQALGHLASLVLEDRDTDGGTTGDNEDLGLDERYFPGGDVSNSVWRR